MTNFQVNNICDVGIIIVYSNRKVDKILLAFPANHCVIVFWLSFSLTFIWSIFFQRWTSLFQFSKNTQGKISVFLLTHHEDDGP